MHSARATRDGRDDPLGLIIQMVDTWGERLPATLSRLHQACCLALSVLLSLSLIHPRFERPLRDLVELDNPDDRSPATEGVSVHGLVDEREWVALESQHESALFHRLHLYIVLEPSHRGHLR